MNIKEKFNNLFKYPAFYWLSICGWTAIVFYLHILLLMFLSREHSCDGTAVFFLFIIHLIIFIILLVPTPVIHIFCKDSDVLIDSPKILNNKLIRTLTTIGIIGFVSFIGLMLCFFF